LRVEHGVQDPKKEKKDAWGQKNWRLALKLSWQPGSKSSNLGRPGSLEVKSAKPFEFEYPGGGKQGHGNAPFAEDLQSTIEAQIVKRLSVLDTPNRIAVSATIAFGEGPEIPLANQITILVIELPK
jgi:hypothetical protein